MSYGLACLLLNELDIQMQMGFMKVSEMSLTYLRAPRSTEAPSENPPTASVGPDSDCRSDKWVCLRFLSGC